MWGSREARSVLVGRVGTIACAIPIEHVVETMRPLPIQPIGEGPAFVKGVAMIRGEPTPVVDTARLLGIAAGGAATRFVVVRAGARRVALELDAVVDVRGVVAAGLVELPPLLRDATSEAIASLGRADAELLVVLEASRVLPEVATEASP